MDVRRGAAAVRATGSTYFTKIHHLIDGMVGHFAFTMMRSGSSRDRMVHARTASTKNRSNE